MHPGNLFIDADGAIVAVDFGIMGRLDRKTRYYLADMLLAFLTGDYRRVAEVHFEAGYVPPHQSLDAFAQACRAIGEPIFGRPMHEISLGRLLAQLFQVTEQFEMETQPQLLLLQKTMVLAEGVGRLLDPSVNMWTLARPLIEEWMRENRGPEARLADAVRDAVEALERLPALLKNVERAALIDGGGACRSIRARWPRSPGAAPSSCWACRSGSSPWRWPRSPFASGDRRRPTPYLRGWWSGDRSKDAGFRRTNPIRARAADDRTNPIGFPSLAGRRTNPISARLCGESAERTNSPSRVRASAARELSAPNYETKPILPPPSAWPLPRLHTRRSVL